MTVWQVKQKMSDFHNYAKTVRMKYSQNWNLHIFSKLHIRTERDLNSQFAEGMTNNDYLTLKGDIVL